MKNRYLQKEKLDQIGGELLKVSRLQNEEIEKIVAEPSLFYGVKARIEAGRSQQEPNRLFSNWVHSGIWNWQKAAASFAVFMVLAVGVFGLINFAKQYYLSPDIAVEIQRQLVPVHVSSPPDIIYSRGESGQTQSIMTKKRAFVRRRGAENKPSIKPRFSKKQSVPQSEELGEFYALTYAGDLKDAVRDAKVIRVNLPPASLFAIGVNVPLENGRREVKADLLIGPDGVTRAIRIVE